MRSFSPLLLVCLAPLASLTASAQEPLFPGPGLIEIVPVGDVVADGQRSITVSVVALQPDGSGWVGLKLKPTASAGSVSGWANDGLGLYHFDWLPPSVNAQRNITLGLKGKTPSKQAVSSKLTVSVAPPMASGLQLSANPSEIILGQVAEATLSLSLVGATGQPLHGAELAVTTNAGKIDTVTSMGAGRFTARYLAPRVNYPHLAIITAVDKRDPTRVVGWVGIPLQGKVDYPVQASPNATVVLRIGDREFGPVQASPEGKAAVPVIVPPGVQNASLVTIVDGQTTEEPIDLRVPETKRVHLFAPPPAIPADSRLEVPIRLVVLTPDGQPDTNAKVSFSATAGTMSPPEHEGNGVFVSRFIPPNTPGDAPVVFTAGIEGSSIQSASIEVSLIPALPASLSLSTDPSTLPEGSVDFKAFVKLLGANGKGLAGQQLSFEASGAEASAGTTDLKGGDYTARFKSSGEGGVTLHAQVQAASTQLPAQQLVLLSDAPRLRNDGADSVRLSLVSVDHFGHPVGGVPVALTLDGQGTLPNTVTTDDHGLAVVYYTAGSSAGLVRVHAVAGDAVADLALVQAPEGVGPELLPASGSAEVIALTEHWRALLPTLQLGASTTAAEGTAAPVAVAATSDGPISTLMVQLTPPQTNPGGTITLKVTAMDADGAGVVGKSLDFLTSKGSFDDPTEVGNGSYEVALNVPADFGAGEITASVVSPSGASQLVRIPISGEAKPWSGGDADASTTPEPPKEPKTKAPAGDHRWARLRAGLVLSTYRYQQLPSTEPGPLLPDALAVGSKYGGANASPMGLEIDARAYAPSLPYIGTNLRFRGTSYSIASAAFDAPAPDWLYDIQIDALGRYPFDVGADQFWVGGTVGFAFNDFIMFEGCLDTGCTVDYKPLSLPGLAVGIEVGAEFLDDFHFIAGVSQGLAYASVPYQTTVDVNAGWEFVDGVFADLGFTNTVRRLVLEGADSGLERGELSDNQTAFKISVGYAL